MRRSCPIWILALVTLLLVSGPAKADEAQVSEDLTTEALALLAKAFPDGSEGAQIEAVKAAVKAPSAAVSKEVGKTALHSKRRAVRMAAAEAVGRMPNPESVKALNHGYKAHQKLKEDEPFFTVVLTAIGRLGDPSSVPILIDKPFKRATIQTSRARIYGLGNIRTVEAVEALLKGMQLTGPAPRGTMGQGSSPLLPDFRAAMTVLTGTDQGSGRALWQKWWRDNKKTFEMDPEMPVVPTPIEERWEAFWGEPYPVETPANGFPQYDWVMEPSDEQVAAALKDMQAARRSKSASAKLAAIYSNMLIVHPKVIKMIPKVAKKSGRSVIEAAIDAMGWIPHKTALKELQRIYRKHRDLYKFENYYSRMLKAIGRHSDASSLDLLLDKPLKGLTMSSGRVRILGAARIRSRASVEKLIKAMQLAGGSGRRNLQAAAETQPFMGVVNMALTILTGQDRGRDKQEWFNWWRNNKRTFVMDQTPPKLSESMREAWEEYWEERYGSR